jgi:hypothetical protein
MNGGGAGQEDPDNGKSSNQRSIRRGSERATKKLANEIICQRAKKGQPKVNEKKSGKSTPNSIIPSLVPETHRKTLSPRFTSQSEPIICSKIKPITKSTCLFPITKRYLTLNEIVLFIGEVKLEILCEDGWHYHVDFLRSGSSMVLHFPHWNQRYDIIANENSIMEYCLSYRGMYSINDGSSAGVKQTAPKVSKPTRKRGKDQKVTTPNKKVRTSRKIKETNYLLESRQEDLDPISPSQLPIGWVGEAVRMVCLGSSMSLNPAAGKFTELSKDMSRLELAFAAQQRRINEIDGEVTLLKSRRAKILSLSSRAEKMKTSSLQHTPQLWWRHTQQDKREIVAAVSKESLDRDQTLLLEEKIQRLEKIDALRKEQIVFSRDKDATLNFLAGNALDIMRSKIREEIATFLFEREDHRQ